jgi:hypothetical protein
MPGDQFPPNPNHWPNVLQDNFFWPDGSFFQFDLPPRYVLNDWTDRREGGIYDVPTSPKPPFAGGFIGWTNWVDKYQQDWRFANVSDANARANIFDEVHDPWMFTEYVYQGRGKDSDLDNATPQSAGIVEPPLLNPVGLTRTIDNTSGVPKITDAFQATLNDQPPTVIPFEPQAEPELEHKWKSDLTNAEFWASDLAAMSWVENLPDGRSNRAFTRLDVQRRVVRYSVPKPNSGVKLYRHPVWVNSTRWGQSQNVPDRVVNVTAPKEYLKPQGRFTGRIVPKIVIKWGVPLSDNCDTINPQKVIRYDGYGSTATMDIWLWGRPLTGPDGVADGTFSYAVAPAFPDKTGDRVLMPRNNLRSTLSWTPPEFVNDDLIHRGCQFWEGRQGSAHCTYFTQFAASFQPLVQVTRPISDNTTPLADFTTTAFSENSYEVRLFLKSDTIPDYRDVTPAGTSPAISLIKTNGQVTAVRFVKTGGTAASVNDLLLSPGTNVTLLLIIRPMNTPYPHHALCGQYAGPAGAAATGRDDAIAGYKAAGGKCKYYSPVGARTVGAYTVQASNGAEWANMQRGLPPGYKKGWADTAAGQSLMDIGLAGGGFTAGLGFAYARNVITPDPFTAGLQQDDFQRVEVTYVPEVQQIEGKQTYYDTPDGKPKQQNPEADIRIRQGTGFFPIDFKEDQPLSGVDTVFFSMVNQTNYRILRNVMHCYKSDKCNSIITDPNGNVGWVRGRYSDVNFSNHALRVPGYPGLDGTDKYCHTGNGRCPFNNLDRRAAEYNENYKILLREILVPFRGSGIAGFGGKGLREAFVDPTSGQLFFLDPSLQNQPSAWANAMCCAVAPDSNSPSLLGHWQPVVTGSDGQHYRIFFYYDVPSFQTGHTLANVWAHVIQFTDDNQPCYVKVTDTALRTKLTTLYGSSRINTIPWIVPIDDDYREPAGNPTFVTNAKPFAGGRNPEYKDHSKRDHMIMCYRGGYTDNSYRTGATDSNQFGGPQWNRSPVAGRSKVSYWIEHDGEWILDGRRIAGGVDVNGNDDYVPAPPRLVNKPGDFGDRTPIDGVPGLALQDGENPDLNRSGDWASVGATYSNDTKAYLAFLRTIWDQFLPIDPVTGDKIRIIPPNPNEDYLPRERYWYRCDKCGIDFPEEEVNYLKQLRHDDGTLYYPIPAGWQPPTGWGAAACGCPRGDGGAVALQGVYDRFMTTWSRGEVDVWAPPGTTVMHDGFFWKNPTIVNRMHHDHLLRKLGTYNPNAMGGGYGLQGLQPGMEKLGRLQPTTARNYQQGISRQLIYPVAADGWSVAQVRQAIKGDYALLDSDQSVVQRAGISAPTAVTAAQEATKILHAGDVVTFWRTIGGEQFVVGLPTSILSPLLPSTLNEPLVQQDMAANPRPQRSSFANDAAGEKLFNNALRNWLLDAVAGSLQYWSSSIFMQANAMAASLLQRGIDPTFASPVDPNTGQTIDVDERLLSPYGQNDGGGLKMVTMTALKRLRNRLLPVLAYDLTAKTYTAGGDFTDRAQAAHTDRFSETRRPMPVPVLGTIEPQVLAATATGRDYYAEWDTGDVSGTKARAYYPVGSTWWRLKQKVGQIKRNGGRNRLHLDDSTKLTDGTYAYPEYTGDTITSTVTYFIHGHVPMDKEVVRALLVYTPQDPPDFEAIGCQGQFTGFVGTPNFFNPNQLDNLEYRGNFDCHWEHYHGFTTNHEHDTGSFAGGDPSPFGGFAGLFSMLHVKHHNTNLLAKDDPSLPTSMMPTPGQPDIEMHPGYAADVSTWLGWLAGGPDNLYLPHVQNTLGQQYVDSWLGFQPDNGDPYQHFLMRATDDAWTWGQPVKFLMNEHQTWKDISSDTYDTLIERYRVRARAAANTNQSVQSLTYFGEMFRKQYFPREQQAIPGWIDLTNYDNSDRFDRVIQIEEKRFDTPPFLVQDDSSGVSAEEPGGGNGSNQAGSVPKVLNITDIVRKHYNDRVNRYYKCTLGRRFDELFDFVKSKTDTNLGQHADFHQGQDDPTYSWNYRYMKSPWGMWLTDPWHHPPTFNGNAVLTGSEEGDPIQQTADDQKARVETVTDWDGSDKLDADPTKYQYHPLSLSATSPSTFDENTPPSVMPVPVGDGTNYWRVLDDQVAVHSFTMDLLQVPYETMRRSWRFRAPGIDSTNALCPNPSCIVHQEGWTVAQFYQHAVGSFGFSSIPSTTSEYCAACRTKLVGVIYNDGDGILTVSYDKPMEPNPLISAVEVQSDHATWLPNAKHGFVVEYYNTIVSQWRTLFDVEWDPIQQKYGYAVWDGVNWSLVYTNAVPSILKGCEGVGGTPKPGTPPGSHFVVVAAQKLRYRVTKPAAVDVQEPAGGGYGACTPNPSQRTVRITTLADTPSRYVNRTIVLKDGVNPDLSAVITAVTPGPGTTPAYYDLRVNGNVTAQHTNYKMAYTQFVSRCTTFRVYGYPYAAGEVTITPPGFVQPMQMADGVDKYPLNAWPSQISRVTMLAGESLQVASREATTIDPGQFYWTVRATNFDGVNYYEIAEGQWYYDYTLNQIVVPTTYLDPADGKLKNIWTLNADKYDDPNHPLQIKTLPTSMSVEYFVGAGVPVDVDVTAFGRGPSYQLDRECVCFIAGVNDDNAPPTDPIGSSDPLPVIGQSVPLKNKAGERVNLTWMVYNHQPLVWNNDNNISMGWLSGDELGAGQWGDSAIMDLFTGRHGDQVSNLGENAIVSGTVTGKVTLYGSPSTILSGNCWVYAKAYTTRTYNFADGSTVVTNERTGGYRSGAFVFRLEVTDNPQNRRTGITSPVPRVLIYLRERNLSESV